MFLEKNLTKLRENSKRKGCNGQPAPKGWKKQRKIANAVTAKGKKLPKRSEKGTALRKKNSKKHQKTFHDSMDATDRRNSIAVRTALEKEKEKCLRPVGFKLLMDTLSKSEKARKPTVRGQKCIAVPQGHPKQLQGLATFVACTFRSELYPNEKTFGLYLVERTTHQMKTDKRLCEVFAVRSTDCFLVPARYGPEFDFHFQPGHGVYVINDALGNVYVGTSQDIANRVARHNAGIGATFTNGKKWWRVQPIPTVASQGQSQESAQFRAQVAVHGQKKVRGAGVCQRVLKKKGR